METGEIIVAINQKVTEIFNEFELQILKSRNIEYAYDYLYANLLESTKVIKGTILRSNLKEFQHQYYMGENIAALLDKYEKKKKEKIILEPPRNKGKFQYDKNLTQLQNYFKQAETRSHSTVTPDYIPEITTGISIGYAIYEPDRIIFLMAVIEAEKKIAASKEYFLNLSKFHSTDKYNSLIKVFAEYSGATKTSKGLPYLSCTTTELNLLVKTIFQYEINSNNYPAIRLRWNAPQSELITLFRILSHEVYPSSAIKLIDLDVPLFISLTFLDSRNRQLERASIERAFRDLHHNRDRKPYLKHKQIVFNILGIK